MMGGLGIFKIIIIIYYSLSQAYNLVVIPRFVLSKPIGSYCASHKDDTLVMGDIIWSDFYKRPHTFNSSPQTHSSLVWEHVLFVKGI
jgi:hypothetical protein